MKAWQAVVVILLLAACGWAVVSYPPGSVSLHQQTDRTPEPAPVESDETVTLLFAGDIMLSRSVGDMMQTKGDWNWPFVHIASVTRGADLMFANLETTVSARGAQNGCGYCFRADPKSVQGLVYAGIDVLSLANNHMWDYGLPALEDTLSYLAVNDVSAVGAGRTLSEARGPVVRTVGNTRVAYLAYTDILPASAQATEMRAGVNIYDGERMVEDIVKARASADVVIVSFHTGTEYETFHNPQQQFIYRSAIDAGADLVVGHHPHVVQDVERYRNKWIVYSLGNFVFDQNWSDATRKGALLEVVVTGGTISDVATISVDISKQYQPTLSE